MKTRESFKILYIDPICLPGHINFNKVQIKALTEEYDDISYCFTEEYAFRLNIPKEDLVYSISQNDVRYNGGMQYRWSIFKILHKIKKNVPLNDYDAIIISCYDEIALKLACFPPSYLINHNNISKSFNRIRKFFLKSISKKHFHLVLNDRSVQRLREINISKVIRIGHGLLNPYTMEKTVISNDSFTIFVPSILSTDKLFLQSLFDRTEFRNYIVSNRISIIVRGEYNIYDSKNITVIKGRMSSEDYIRYLTNSDCLLICYPFSFKYRVSGVLLEAIANSKKCIIRLTPDFEEYKDIFGEDAYFSDSIDIYKAIESVRNSKYNLNINQNNQSKLIPNYSFLKKL